MEQGGGRGQKEYSPKMYGTHITPVRGMEGASQGREGEMKTWSW